MTPADLAKRPAAGAPVPAAGTPAAGTLAAGMPAAVTPAPAGVPPATAALMQALARFIEHHAAEVLTLAALARQVHLSPTYLQRSFRAVFGVSPKEFQDAVRMQRLKQGLQSGKPVLEASFEAGFQSSSRVYGHPQRALGMTPSRYRAGGAGEHLVHACRTTRYGLLMMAATARGVCFAQFGSDQESLLATLRQEFPRAQLQASAAVDSAELDAWIGALDAHLMQQAPCPELPLDLRGTAFQIRVWKFLLQIPAGKVCTYAEVARAIQAPNAVRAVGSACGANRIALLVPCHRVLRQDGGLGGYRWGLERKRALLAEERGLASNAA